MNTGNTTCNRFVLKQYFEIGGIIVKIKNAWIIEVDHTAASGKGYTMKTVFTFAEAKSEADRISKRDDVYLVSLYKFDSRIYAQQGYREPRAYIQRNGGNCTAAIAIIIGDMKARRI